MKRWIIILLGVPMLLWSVYWAAAAYAVGQGIDTAQQGQLPGGLSYQSANSQISGFPTAFNVTASDVTLEQEGLFAWTAPSVQVIAASHRPNDINLSVSGQQHIRSQLGSLTVEATNFSVELLLHPALSLPLGTLQIRLQDADIAHETGWFTQLAHLEMVLSNISGTAETTPGQYNLLLDANTLDLQGLLPDLPDTHHELQTLTTDLDLMFAREWDLSALNNDIPQLQAVAIQQVNTRFGSTELMLTGQLIVNEDQTISGDVIVEIEGANELLSVLREAGYVDPDIADLVTTGLSNEDPNVPLRLPLRISENRVSFGMFTLGILPRLP